MTTMQDMQVAIEEHRWQLRMKIERETFKLFRAGLEGGPPVTPQAMVKMAYGLSPAMERSPLSEEEVSDLKYQLHMARQHPPSPPSTRCICPVCGRRWETQMYRGVDWCRQCEHRALSNVLLARQAPVGALAWFIAFLCALGKFGALVLSPLRRFVLWGAK